MKIILAQLKISHNIQDNKDKILKILSEVNPNEWIIFPEGMISGYYPEDPKFISKIDTKLLQNAINEINIAVNRSGIIVLIGSVTFEKKIPYNSTLIFYKDKVEYYNKCNLSTLDRSHFNQGDSLNTYKIDDIELGIQMCRENAFPEQWTLLKKNKAKVIFHINNAVAEFDGKRKSLLLARAQENQLFVVSVNTVTDTGPLSSMVINPYGDLVYEAPLLEEVVQSIEINLDEVKNDYLEQKREDLVKTVRVL